MIWSYLRRKVRESILAGVSDAMVEIEGNGPAEDTSGALALLRSKLTTALPAPASAEMPNGTPTIAQDSTDATDGPAAAGGTNLPARNGRRKAAAV